MEKKNRQSKGNKNSKCKKKPSFGTTEVHVGKCTPDK